MQVAHRSNVVILEKAHDKVAFAEYIVTCLLRESRYICGCGQQTSKLEHFRYPAEIEHASHQHEQCCRMCCQLIMWTAVYDIEHLIGL